MAYCPTCLRCASIAMMLGAAGCTFRIDARAGRSDSATSAGGGYRTFSFSPLADTVFHLTAGDSVQMQQVGPVSVPNEPNGLFLTYYPYFDIRDTDRVKRVALEVFDAIRPRFTKGEPPWLVLRAADRSTSDRNRGGQDHFYGVVLKRQADGKWYPLHGGTPVR